METTCCLFLPSGHLATIRGTVVRMGAVRPLIQHMHFVCGKCGCRTGVKFPDGRYTLPSKCDGESLHHLMVNLNSALNLMVRACII